jgi:hypothetical protein
VRAQRASADSDLTRGPVGQTTVTGDVRVADDEPKRELPDLPSPEAVVRAAVSRLPDPLGWLTRNAYTVFLWVTLPTSFASAIGNLQLVLHLLDELRAALPLLAPLLNAVGAVVSPALEVWRGFTRPVVELLESFVRFSVPPEALDLAILILLPLPRWRATSVAKRRAVSIWRGLRSIIAADPEAHEYAASDARHARAISERAIRRAIVARRWMYLAVALALVGSTIVVLDYFYRAGTFAPG